MQNSDHGILYGKSLIFLGHFIFIVSTANIKCYCKNEIGEETIGRALICRCIRTIHLPKRKFGFVRMLRRKL